MPPLPTTLTIQDNSLGGRFPSALLSVTSLAALDLGNNAFNRTLPTGLTSLTRLTYLCLVSNQVLCTKYAVLRSARSCGHAARGKKEGRGQYYP